MLANINKTLGINPISTTAYNPKANWLIERFHRTLKAALIARGNSWLQDLPMALFGIHMHPDENGSSTYSRVFGEQTLLPRIVVQSGSMEEVNKALQRLQCPHNMPRSRIVKQQVDSKLDSSTHVWLQLDRVKRSLEAPYRQTFTLEIRGQPNTVSIERLKAAVLPKSTDTETQKDRDKDAVSTNDSKNNHQNIEVTDSAKMTQSGRRVQFSEKKDYLYF